MGQEEALRDVRELLQYVPQFSGRTFAIELPWLQLTDSQKSEVMLDVAALQSIGVHLALAVPRVCVPEIVGRAIDFDLKLENDIQQNPADALAVMQRGQIVMVPCGEQSVLEPALVELVGKISADKVIALVVEDLSSEYAGSRSLSEEEWLAGQGSQWPFYDSVSQLLMSGISRVHLLDCKIPGVILAELFSNEGCGLMVYRDSYRVMRKMRNEDIPEVLTMIGRSVRSSNLVPREYEDIENAIADYYVYQIDGNVVGCAALHQYANGWAEVACLYVKHGHQGHGYGEQLVQFIESEACHKKVQYLFALTNGAADFFTQKLGYNLFGIEEIPSSRRKMLEASGRESLAFFKDLKEKKSSV